MTESDTHNRLHDIVTMRPPMIYQIIENQIGSPNFPTWQKVKIIIINDFSGQSNLRPVRYNH